MPPKPKAPYQLTPEQQALQAARREQKAKRAALASTDKQGPKWDEPGYILRREWTNIREPDQNSFKLSVMTWNVLAQSLIRRELFPKSDALKFGTRGPMLSTEIMTYDADILCLQEADRLDELLPAVSSRYTHIYAAGRNKAHGCMMLLRKDLLEEVSHRVVYYDEEDVRQGSLEGMDDATAQLWRRGMSRVTKNIGLIAAIKRKNDPGAGYIFATTHLFWHPAYVYERFRQVGLLLRSIAHFKKELELEDWPCIIAGDLNLTPDDVTYSTMVGESVTASQEKMFSASRVVHVSVDPTIDYVPTTQLHQEVQDDEEGGGGGEQNDPDRVITNSRPCREEDGLMTLEELRALHESSGMLPLRSVYDESMPLLPTHLIETDGRASTIQGRRGSNEPSFTSYTHYWKSKLDYIFLAMPRNRTATVEAILPPHKKADMDPGLPKRNVCGSDHISLGATLAFGESAKVEQTS